MSRPAPVSFYTPGADAPLHCSWTVPLVLSGTADGSPYIFPSVCTGCSHLCNTAPAGCLHIPSVPAPGSPGSVSHNPLLCGCPGHPDRKPCLRNGSFPAAVPASACSSCARVHFPYFPSDTAGHGRGIPDVLNRTSKSMVRGHGPGSPGNPL